MSSSLRSSSNLTSSSIPYLQREDEGCNLRQEKDDKGGELECYLPAPRIRNQGEDKKEEREGKDDTMVEQRE